MPYQKIATCCYCGSRAALVLKGQIRHELACANCGAPLHELKMLRADAGGDRELVRCSRIRSVDPRQDRKKKKSRSLSQRFMEQLRDAAEDAFEDLFDIFD